MLTACVGLVMVVAFSVMWWREIPVVVLTTSQAEEDILRAYQLHANCYVTKPVDFNQFLHIVATIEEFWLSVVKLPKRVG